MKMCRFAAGFLVFLAACSKPVITVWSAYGEMESAVREAAGQGVRFREIPEGFSPDGIAFFTKPEIIILDGRMLQSWAESGLLLEGEDFFPDTERPVRLYQGRLCALFLNGGSGALCYNKKAAEKYLDSSDPLLVQRELGDLNSFIVRAYHIGVRSAGSCAVLPAVEELQSAFEHTRTIPMQGAELTEDMRRRWFADVAGLFHDRRWDGLEDEAGNVRELFAFFLPPLSPFEIPAGEARAADWAIIPGPDPLGRGGAWLALYQDAGEDKRKADRIRKLLAMLAL
jgi:hypothetical protein